MDLANPATVKHLLHKHDFTFSKALGQNFLIDSSVCPRMAGFCRPEGVDENWGVLEIGAGFGVLTAQLAQQAKKVVAVETDTRLLPVLGETLAPYANIRVLQGDILKMDLRALLQEEFGSMPCAVCANLPYYLTSPLLMLLLESRLPIGNITVMVQKEAAERICAQIGSRLSGAVTVAVQYYAAAQLLFEVTADAFLPPPKVDSSVIRLTVRKIPPVSLQDEAFFFRMVRAAFGQRRKTAANAIAAGLNLPKALVQEALAQAELPESARAEALTMQQLADLAQALLDLQEANGV